MATNQKVGGSNPSCHAKKRRKPQSGLLRFLSCHVTFANPENFRLRKFSITCVVLIIALHILWRTFGFRIPDKQLISLLIASSNRKPQGGLLRFLSRHVTLGSAIFRQLQKQVFFTAHRIKHLRFGNTFQKKKSGGKQL